MEGSDASVRAYKVRDELSDLGVERRYIAEQFPDCHEVQQTLIKLDEAMFWLGQLWAKLDREVENA